MSIDLSRVTGISDSRGVITEIKDSLGRVIWAVSGGKVILEVEKITRNTYAGETTYENEQFILLDIYPKTNGTVKVTYGGLTKTITDTSGAAEPNAQQVFFGTFNGVSDSVTTPASGELTIEGDYYAFGGSKFNTSSKNTSGYIGITEVVSFGSTQIIPEQAFSNSIGSGLRSTVFEIPDTIKRIGNRAFQNTRYLETVIIGSGVEVIGNYAFYAVEGTLKTIRMQRTVPPELVAYDDNGTMVYNNFGVPGEIGFTLVEIIVPKGCGNAYKTPTGWSTYADYIVEES